MPAAGPSRRERLREELLQQVRRAARQLVAEHGAAGLTMAAVGKAVGIAPPALYRYFPRGRAELLGTVSRDLMDDLIVTIVAARDVQPAGDLAAQLHAPTHALMRWCHAHRREFDLLMGSAYYDAVDADGELLEHVTLTIGPVFIPMFVQIWQDQFPFPADDELPAGLARRLVPYRDSMLKGSGLEGTPLPLGVAYWMITCWRQIYGVLCMAAYGHLGFAFGNYEDVFDDLMARLLEAMNLQVSPHVILDR